MGSKNIALRLKEINEQLARGCKKGGFPIHFKNNGLSLIVEGTEEAYNEKKNVSEKIKVSKLCNDFDNIWMYSQIIFDQIEAINYSSYSKEQKEDYKFYQTNSFEIGKALFKISISLSIYQGLINEKKVQLFRAEWDNHKNEVHPQPHWQFYPNFIGENAKENNIEELAFERKEFDFLEYEEEKNNEISYNFKNFHFSMSSGNWASELAHINYIKNDIELINWYVGLLKHIKNQFIHCSK